MTETPRAVLASLGQSTAARSNMRRTGQYGAVRDNSWRYWAIWGSKGEDWSHVKRSWAILLPYWAGDVWREPGGGVLGVMNPFLPRMQFAATSCGKDSHKELPRIFQTSIYTPVGSDDGCTRTLLN